MSPLLRFYNARDDRVTRGEKLLQRIPIALLEYPLEVALAAWGMLSGPPRILGLRDEGSIGDLLPAWGIALFASMMTLGAGTTLWGLYRHRYGSTVARGLELLGTTYLCYAIALFSATSVPSALVGALLVILAGLCWLRAWMLVLRSRRLRRMSRSAQDTLSAIDEREAGDTTGSEL